MILTAKEKVAMSQIEFNLTLRFGSELFSV